MFRNPEKTAIIILNIGICIYLLTMLFSTILGLIEKQKTRAKKKSGQTRIVERIISFMIRNRVALTHYFYFIFVILIVKFGSFNKILMFIGFIVSATGGFFRAWAIRYKLDEDKLIKAGPFRYVRHPRYFGNFLIGLGITILSSNLIIVFLFMVCFFVLYYAKIKNEDKMLGEKYGGEYYEYKRNVGTFIPFYRTLKTKEKIDLRYKEMKPLKSMIAFFWAIIMTCFVAFLLNLKILFSFRLF